MLTATVHGALRRSVPIAALAMTASAAGVFLPSTYAAETRAWAAQASGQDMVNLFVVYPALLVLARRARRGSMPAYLCWTGLLGYSTYSYVLYAGYTRFSSWFPVYVAILGLSGWTLASATAPLRAQAVAAAFHDQRAARLAGTWLVAFGGFYSLVELAVVARAIVGGSAPQSAVVAGLPTDPVIMLDLAFVLPGMVAAGLLLRGSRAAAYPAGTALLSFSVAMGLAVSTMLVVTGIRIPPLPLPVIVGFGLLTLGHVLVLWRLLRTADPNVPLHSVLRID